VRPNREAGSADVESGVTLDAPEFEEFRRISLDISRTIRVGLLTCSDGAESLNHLVMLRLREQLHLRSSMPAASREDRAGISVGLPTRWPIGPLYVPPTWSRV
jgi:hypothetical protein